jgi:hypothetical protein
LSQCQSIFPAYKNIATAHVSNAIGIEMSHLKFQPAGQREAWLNMQEVLLDLRQQPPLSLCRLSCGHSYKAVAVIYKARADADPELLTPGPEPIFHRAGLSLPRIVFILVQEPEAEKLIQESLAVNYVDMETTPSTTTIQNRWVEPQSVHPLQVTPP